MMHWKVAALLFSSGFCALVYQMAWLRSLRLVFGASTAATAAVLAIFMAGLGLGSAVLGKRVDRLKRPLRYYAKLEIGIALLAVFSPFLISLVRMAYFAMGGTLAMGTVGGTIARLVLATLVLGIPTFLMGGTLPAAVRAVETEQDLNRKSTGLIYGANTLGAVTGSFLATFFLLEWLGVQATLFGAAAINGLVGIVAWRLAIKSDEVTPDADVKSTNVIRAPNSRFVVIAAGVVGFAFLLMELVWYRMLAPILGGSSYTFGLILVVALLGIGIGSLLYSRRAADRPVTLTTLAVTCALEALFLGIPLFLGDSLAYGTMVLRGLATFGFGGLVFSWFVVTLVVVLPGAIVSGYQFPVLVALLGRGREGVGDQVGRLYAYNTVGAILGSLGGGFGVMPMISAPNAWRLVIGVLVALGLCALLLDWMKSTWRIRVIVLGLALGALGSLFVLGPTAAWRHRPIGAGIVSAKLDSINAYQNWLNDLRRVVFWEREGVESSVALNRTNGYAFVINGKVDGNARGDAPTQVMGAILSGALPVAPKTGLVIGLGTGSTAGWLAKVPSIERVDAVELEPAILDVVKMCAPVNEDCLNNPKVNTIIADAREVLTTTSESYDVVFSEPSNPYRAGIASLFTQEFYRAVSSRLSDNGLLLQWVQAYHVDAQTIRTVFATMKSVFGAVEVWESTMGSDLILVASKEPIVHDVGRIKKLVSSEPFDRALATVWGVHGIEGLFTGFIGGPELVTRVAADETEVCTDDNSLVEYGFARGLGRARLFETSTLRRVASQMGVDRPNIKGGTIDWNLVEESRTARGVIEARPWQNYRSSAPFGKAEKQRVSARKHYTAGRLPQVLDAWEKQDGKPQTIVDHIMLAEVLAMKGSDSAKAHIDEVRKFQPVMALAIEAQWLVATKNIEGAVGKLEDAFSAYRVDPWPFRPVMDRALYLAYELGKQNPELAPRLDAAMAEEFAVGCLDERRMTLRVKMAFESKAKGLCTKALEPMEPHVPWNKGFLEQRYACYKAEGETELLGQAAEDLVRYLAVSPPALFESE